VAVPAAVDRNDAVVASPGIMTVDGCYMMHRTARPWGALLRACWSRPPGRMRLRRTVDERRHLEGSPWHLEPTLTPRDASQR